MERNELLNTLKALHENLTSTDQVDEEAERMLRVVTNDIEKLLDDDRESPEEDSGSLASRLQSMVLEWEADHPKIAQLIGKAAETLSNLGI